MKVKSNRDYTIPFVGLSLGFHEFKFDITDAFFDSFEYSIIQKATVTVVFLLEKKETMLVGNYTIDGVVEINCNRCEDPMNVAIGGEYKLIYKFGSQPSDDESLITVYPEEFELDIRENILELITVSLPNRVVHDKGDCNQEMISILEEYILVSENDKENEEKLDNDEIDPRWSALNRLN